MVDDTKLYVFFFLLYLAPLSLFFLWGILNDRSEADGWFPRNFFFLCSGLADFECVIRPRMAKAVELLQSLNSDSQESS